MFDGDVIDTTAIMSGQARHGRFFFRPRPSVRDPKLGYDMQSCGVGTSIICGDTNVDVIRFIFVLGILEKVSAGAQYCVYMRIETHLDKDIPVSVLIKHIRVKDFVFSNIPTAILVLGYEFFVRVTALRVFIEKFHIRVSWSRVEVVV